MSSAMVASRSSSSSPPHRSSTDNADDNGNLDSRPSTRFAQLARHMVHQSASSRFDTTPLPKYLSIRIYDLKGFHLSELDMAVLGVGGLSDPFIVVTADPPDILYRDNNNNSPTEIIKSDIVYHNINPVWDKSINFELKTIDTKGLAANAHLFLSVWDHDFTQLPQLIGTLCISFKEIFEAYDKGEERFEFHSNLMNNALIHGELQGKIKLYAASKFHRVIRDIKDTVLLDTDIVSKMGLNVKKTLGDENEDRSTTTACCTTASTCSLA
jgi:Ca2+-dependent lipid-binding protein